MSDSSLVKLLVQNDLVIILQHCIEQPLCGFFFFFFRILTTKHVQVQFLCFDDNTARVKTDFFPSFY